jgi:hypothetical protein
MDPRGAKPSSLTNLLSHVPTATRLFDWPTRQIKPRPVFMFQETRRVQHPDLCLDPT